VEARVISSRKEERVAASKILPQPRDRNFKGNRARLIDAVRDGLYASKIVSYAQGMELLRSRSAEYRWDLNLSDIAPSWRGGCTLSKNQPKKRSNEERTRRITLGNDRNVGGILVSRC